jgi:ElaB/YqjD/DUF883 family membrane-anchored ribosome-binding protein
MSNAKDGVKDAIGETVAKARVSVDKVAEKTGEMMSDVRGYAEHVFDQSRQGYRQAAERAEEGFRQAGSVIRENPGLTISAAVGLGIAVGVMVGLRMGTDRRWR